MRPMRAISISVCGLVLLTCAATAEVNNNNKNQRPPPRQAPLQRPVQRPMTQQGQTQRGQRGVQGNVRTNNQGGQGRRGVQQGAGGVQQNQRSNLIQMVKPVGVAPVRPPPSGFSGQGGSSRGGSKPNVVKSNFSPAKLSHDAHHRIGRACERFGHKQFAFRRAGGLYHRRYYLFGGVWYWYDAPFVETDPDYDMVDDGTLPSCDPDADECQQPEN